MTSNFQYPQHDCCEVTKVTVLHHLQWLQKLRKIIVINTN